MACRRRSGAVSWRRRCRPPDEADLVGATRDTPDAATPGDVVIGIPAFIGSATLRIAGRIVQLEGVMGIGAAYVRDVESYIGDREIVCRPTMAGRYRCPGRWL